MKNSTGLNKPCLRRFQLAGMTTISCRKTP